MRHAVLAWLLRGEYVPGPGISASGSGILVRERSDIRGWPKTVEGIVYAAGPRVPSNVIGVGIIVRRVELVIRMCDLSQVCQRGNFLVVQCEMPEV